jgi:hypothetical protein
VPVEVNAAHRVRVGGRPEVGLAQTATGAPKYGISRRRLALRSNDAVARTSNNASEPVDALHALLHRWPQWRARSGGMPLGQGEDPGLAEQSCGEGVPDQMEVRSELEPSAGLPAGEDRLGRMSVIHVSRRRSSRGPRRTPIPITPKPSVSCTRRTRRWESADYGEEIADAGAVGAADEGDIGGADDGGPDADDICEQEE